MSATTMKISRVPQKARLPLNRQSPNQSITTPKKKKSTQELQPLPRTASLASIPDLQPPPKFNLGADIRQSTDPIKEMPKEKNNNNNAASEPPVPPPNNNSDAGSPAKDRNTVMPQTPVASPSKSRALNSKVGWMSITKGKWSATKPKLVDAHDGMSGAAIWRRAATKYLHKYEAEFEERLSELNAYFNTINESEGVRLEELEPMQHHELFAEAWESKMNGDLEDSDEEMQRIITELQTADYQAVARRFVTLKDELKQLEKRIIENHGDLDVMFEMFVELHTSITKSIRNSHDVLQRLKDVAAPHWFDWNDEEKLAHIDKTFVQAFSEQRQQACFEKLESIRLLVSAAHLEEWQKVLVGMKTDMKQFVEITAIVKRSYGGNPFKA